MTTFQTVAREFASAFASRVTNHETVRGAFPRQWFLKDDSPDWMRDAIRDAHSDGRLPDDWLYESCSAMVDSIAGRDSADECDTCEIADSQVDIYTSELCAWLAMHSGNLEACNEAVSEGLCPDDADMVKRMQTGQYILLDRACAALIAAIDAQADERDDARDLDEVMP